MLPWYFWCLVVILIFLVIWLLSRGIKEKFVGLNVFRPLDPGILPQNHRIVNTFTSQSTSIPSTPNIGSIPTTPLTVEPDTRFNYTGTPHVRGGVKTIKPVLRSKEPEKFTVMMKKDEERSAGEAECVRVMKEYYGVDFYTVRTNILTNPETKAWLEIDVFNTDLIVNVQYKGEDFQYRVGVEYNGIQHTVWPNFTKQTLKDFLMQIRRDQYKLRKCDENNIFIITVPHTIPISMIKNFIIWFLPHNVLARKEKRENGEKIPEYPAVFGSPPKIQINDVSQDELDQANEEIRRKVIALGWSDPRSATYIPTPSTS